jgi:hypothetical protein
MSRKRTTLDSILAPPRPTVEPPATAAVVAEKPASLRPSVEQQTVYLPLAIYEQLRRVAFDERVKMHQLLLEGLDRVFRDRGLPGLDELRRREH